MLAASTQGSGGYGDVLERDPQAVAEDVRADRISDWTAREVFAVVYDPETLICRRGRPRPSCAGAPGAAARARRGPTPSSSPIGCSGGPPEQVLKYFGEWPSGAPNRAVVRI